MIQRYFDIYLHAGIRTPLIVNANQYDENEQWIFTLLNADGSVYVPGVGSAGAIIGMKADGHAIENAAVIDGNGRIVVTETKQMTAVAGTSVFELVLDGEHGTANFILQVERRPADEDSDYSESDLSLISQAIDMALDANAVRALQEGLATETSERIAAVSAEASARQTADNVLQGQIDEFVALPDGSTTADAELTNIRVGYDGTTYPSAGDAVRSQVSDLNDAMDALGITPINIIDDSKYRYNTFYRNTVGTSTINDINTTSSGNCTYGVYPCIDGDVIKFSGRTVNTHYLYDTDGILRKYDTSTGKTEITCSVEGYTIGYWAIVDKAAQGVIKAWCVPSELSAWADLYGELALTGGTYAPKEILNIIEQLTGVRCWKNDVIASNYSELLPSFDSAPINRIFNISGCLQSIDGIPDTNALSGTLISLNGDYHRETNVSKAWTVQLFIDTNNALYYRSCWGGTWSAWANDRDLINSLLNSAMQSVRPDITQSNYSTELPDLDTAKVSMIININGCLQSIAHIPSTLSTSATLVTFNGDYTRNTNVNKSFTLQMLVDASGILWMRSCWGGSWKSWINIANGNDIKTVDYNPFNFMAVPKFGIIGDSLSVGAHTNRAGTTVNDKTRSWGKYISDVCNNTPLWLGFGGATTTLWIESTRADAGLTAALNPENECDAYLIGLGYNDANPNSTSGGVILGSMADIDPDDPDDNAVSFYGNLDKILRKLHTAYPYAPLFVFTNPYYNVVDVPDYNTAVRNVCTNLGTGNNVHLIDLYNLYNDIFVSFASDREGNHYHAQIYAYIGRLIVTAVSNYMLKNPTLFKYVGE